MAFWDRLKSGLAKTRDALRQSLEPVLEQVGRLDPTRPAPDAALLESLEEALLAADVGVATVEALVERVRQARPRDRAELEAVLVEAVTEAVAGPAPAAGPWAPPVGVKPWVVLVIGVNGTGKTTTIGKLAAREAAQGRRVLLVAADTFRAAAGEQLEEWARRAGAELVRQQAGADPAAVAHDGLAAALSRGADTVFIDTAGRLHTRVNLMEELSKVKRVVARQLPGAPHEVLLVLDGTLGQNGFAQARQFHAALGVTAVALTKLDGTARGGVVLAVAGELGLPVRLVGVGEGVDDLGDFDPRAFAEALVRG
jgi:fused signal recognition particle receptor